MDTTESGLLDFKRFPDLRELSEELTDAERWYAAHMLARERALEEVFGVCEPPGKVLSPGDEQLTINWPGGGVYQYPPREGRTGWHYVTHGLSQPHSPEEAAEGRDAEEVFSGLGLELVISTPEKSRWAPALLLDFVRYLLFSDTPRLFAPGDRVPYRGFQSLGEPTALTHLLLTGSHEYPHGLRLPGGECWLLHLVGVTDAEIEQARSLGEGPRGSYVLANALIELGEGLATTPRRRCITTHPRFEEAWAAVLACFPE